VDVQDLEGRTWTVRRRWLPAYAHTARKRWRWGQIGRRASGSLEVVEIDSAILLAIALVAVFAIAFVALPLLIDAVIVVLAVLLGGIVRTVFRRPWTVEAVSGETRLTRPVVGWLASGRARTEWAEELRHGRGQERGAHGPGLLS
jgi:hypothetical protein